MNFKDVTGLNTVKIWIPWLCVGSPVLRTRFPYFRKLDVGSKEQDSLREVNDLIYTVSVPHGKLASPPRIDDAIVDALDILVEQ